MLSLLSAGVSSYSDPALAAKWFSMQWINKLLQTDSNRSQITLKCEGVKVF